MEEVYEMHDYKGNAPGECTLMLEKWSQELVVKLLKVTHGQWLYKRA